MKRKTAVAVVLAVVVLGGTSSVCAERPRGDNSLLLKSQWLAQQGENDPALVTDAPCATADDCRLWFYSVPRWSASAGVVALQRNDMPEKDLLVAEGGEIVMTTEDVDVNWGAGPRVTVARHLDCGWDFEVVYFSIDNFVGSAEAHDATPLVEEDFWQQFVFDDLEGIYTNDLYSLEFNLKWPIPDCCRWKGIIGFRWVELGEEAIADVSLVQDPFVLSEWAKLALDNHLYGVHFGAEGVLWEPCCSFRVEGFVKAGVFGNDADWVLVTEGDLDNREWVKGESQSAFISEMGLMAVYQPCCWMKVFAGYEALHLKEVATAIVQTKRDVVFDHAFYHGVVLGAEISFGTRCVAPCEGSYPCE